MISPFLPAILSALVLVSCNSHGGSGQTQKDMTTNNTKAPSDTNTKIRAATTQSDDTQTSDEINNLSGLPVDSMNIAYHATADKIYGYRKDDTLHVDGDIMFIVPRQGSKGVGTANSRWPVINNKIVIPYKVASDFPNPNRVSEALAMWSGSLPVEFRSRTFQTDYLVFVRSSDTKSFVGRIGGMQPVEIADWRNKGNVAHEIGHALGLYHEQSRSDRDKYVKVSCTNDPNYMHAFKEDPYARDLRGYNFYSIMHYSPNNCLSVLVNGLPDGIPGQRNKITNEDYQSVKQIYGIR